MDNQAFIASDGHDWIDHRADLALEPALLVPWLHRDLMDDARIAGPAISRHALRPCVDRGLDLALADHAIVAIELMHRAGIGRLLVRAAGV